MRTLLGDASVVDDDDLVGVVHRGEPVGDDDRRAPLQQRVERILHQLFALGVECRGRLVEDQDLGIFQHRAGDRQPLPLAARQFHAAVADVGLVALVGLHDEVVGVGYLGRGDDLVVRGVEFSQ